MRLCGDRIRLRKVTAEDCELLWHWSNDPGVRENSFTHDPIAWDAHINWFTKRMQDPRSYQYVGVDRSDVPVGRVRFDITGGTARVSVAVASDHRGKGYGTDLIEQGASIMFHQTWVTEIHAFVKPSNTASMRLFEKCDFKKVGTATVYDQEAIHYVLPRSREQDSNPRRIVPR